MTTEEWRPIAGAADYFVSDQGRVLSLKRAEPRVLRLDEDHKGYFRVKLATDGGLRARYIHLLVAEAFHGVRPAPEMHARHLNGDCKDNRALNLCWGTASENERDKLLHGTNHNLNKTHCPSGHAYDEANTYVLPSRPTARYCRTCNRGHRAQRTTRGRRSAAFRDAQTTAA